MSGALSASGHSAPFSPELGRPIWVRLLGSWTDLVTLERRVDGGLWFPVTLGGEALTWTANRNELAYEEGVSGPQYRLNFARMAGSLDHEMQQ